MRNSRVALAVFVAAYPLAVLVLASRMALNTPDDRLLYPLFLAGVVLLFSRLGRRG